ncbi:PucR family transcriptional regulator ligand-binding domain-containing protein, partial [Anaerosalibacter bizertensis]|nr:PucR family transcriptional regulator ligand-binding domain-containing protein [Anaerosalibacter bizertensis]
MITVKEALQLKGLREAKILSGHDGLDRKIEYVDVMEMPDNDVDKWLKPNTLMLTSFYAIKDDKLAQIDMIKKMFCSEVSCLVVDPRFYLGQVSEEIINTSNKLGFPIIELPAQTGYVDVITPILEEIFKSNISMGGRFEHINELFTNILLHSGGIKEISYALSEIINSSIIILDEHLNCIAGVNIDRYHDKLFDEIVKKDKIKYFIKNFELDYKKNEFPIEKDILYNGKEIKLTFFIIDANKDIQGYIVLWQYNSILDDIHLHAINVAKRYIAIEIIKKI